MSESRIFELLNECHRCGRHSFGRVRLYLLMADRTVYFCSGRCKAEHLDTHPSDLGDLDPRYDMAR